MIAKRRFFFNQPKQKHVYLPLNVTFFRACVITYNVHLHKRAIFFRIMHVYITFHFYCYKYAKLIDRESFWPPPPTPIFNIRCIKCKDIHTWFTPFSKYLLPQLNSLFYLFGCGLHHREYEQHIHNLHFNIKFQ